MSENNANKCAECTLVSGIATPETNTFIEKIPTCKICGKLLNRMNSNDISLLLQSPYCITCSLVKPPTFPHSTNLSAEESQDPATKNKRKFAF